MIDLHCHILPGVDDGAPNTEASVEMARAAYENGITVIAASPHILDKKNLKLTRETIVKAAEELQAELDKQGIKIKILPSGEYFMDRNIPRILKDYAPVSTIGKGPYLLVEMPAISMPANIEYSVLNLSEEELKIREQLLEIRPIMAHPERNQDIMRNWKQIYKLLDNGYLLQLNLGSITGMYGRHVRKTAEALLKAGLGDIIATDAHTSRQIVKLFKDGFKTLRKLVGEERLKLMTEVNPRLILEGEAVETP